MKKVIFEDELTTACFPKTGIRFNRVATNHALPPIEYIRRKLRVIEAYHKNPSVQALAAQLSLHPRTIRGYLNTYIAGGLPALYVPEKRPQPTNLTVEQEAAFKQQLLRSRPADHGLEGNIWTGQVMRQYIKKTYSVDYHSGIYDLLERLNLSHQKAHADYGNADPIQQ